RRDLSILAAQALARIGEAAVPPLIKVLQERNDRVAFMACDALYHMGPKAKDAVPALVLRLRDLKDVLDRRPFVVEILLRIGPPAKVAERDFLEILQDSTEADYFRSSCLQALQKLDAAPKDLKSALIRVLERGSQEPANMRSLCIDALPGLGGEAKA